MTGIRYHTRGLARAAGGETCENMGIRTAPRRCVNTVAPRGLADWIGVD